MRPSGAWSGQRVHSTSRTWTCPNPDVWPLEWLTLWRKMTTAGVARYGGGLIGRSLLVLRFHFGTGYWASGRLIGRRPRLLTRMNHSRFLPWGVVEFARGVGLFSTRARRAKDRFGSADGRSGHWSRRRRQST